VGRRLNTFVHVDGVAYGPDSEVPAEVAKRIGDHAWQQDDGEVRGEPGPEAVGFTDPGTGGRTAGAPPRSGRGSGIEAWRAFAEQNGVGVDSDMSREDIIAAAEAAGVVDREE